MSQAETPTGLLFPGQGAQKVGMCRTLLEQFPPARALFAAAREVLGYDLQQICLEGPAAQLDATEYSQPALFVASLAALAKLKHDQPAVVEEARAVAGLSLGEYTALVAAGVMDFETGLRIVQRRGAAMQEAANLEPSGMVSILGLDGERISELCAGVRQGAEVLQVANLLCPGNIVVSGHLDACRRLSAEAVAAGAMKAIPLAVAGAFHTPLMEPAVGPLRAALATARLNAPTATVVSNVDAQPHDDPEQIRELLAQQVTRPVRWEESVRWMLSHGVKSFYEVGPGTVLRGLLKRIDRKIPCHGVADVT
jgi:[acyl-carrier-protein] S-malonyltransferase